VVSVHVVNVGHAYVVLLISFVAAAARDSLFWFCSVLF